MLRVESRDVIFTEDALRSKGKRQQEFSTGRNHAQRNGLICWSQIKPSLTQTPKLTAWQNCHCSNQRREESHTKHRFFSPQWTKENQLLIALIITTGVSGKAAAVAQPAWVASRVDTVMLWNQGKAHDLLLQTLPLHQPGKCWHPDWSVCLLSRRRKPLRKPQCECPRKGKQVPKNQTLITGFGSWGQRAASVLSKVVSNSPINQFELCSSLQSGRQQPNADVPQKPGSSASPGYHCPGGSLGTLRAFHQLHVVERILKTPLSQLEHTQSPSWLNNSLLYNWLLLIL